MGISTTLLTIFGCTLILVSAAALSGLVSRKMLNLLGVVFLLAFILLFHDRFPYWWTTLKWELFGKL